ncbi:MAG: hypothetical protein A2X84_04805 [Desulfuromonadaceae bacterium GWC2_58_13]|nr:MAG: hypothetical protein A2X84_04805 [Desulfuromonadaceae bacterium GWC2_58_13]
MIKVRSFGEPLQPFKAHGELLELDERINRFIEETNLCKVINLSDTAIADITGATVGLVRVLVYED